MGWVLAANLREFARKGSYWFWGFDCEFMRKGFWMGDFINLVCGVCCMKFEDGSEEIIGVFYEVYNFLGAGFLEKVYEEAMAIEFRLRGIEFSRQVGIEVYYKGERAGKYMGDFIVGDIIVEVKAKRCLDKFDDAQLINYLKGTGKKVGLLVNFGGEKLEFKRRVLGL